MNDNVVKNKEYDLIADKSNFLLERISSTEDRKQLENALKFSVKMHHGQVRKSGLPFVSHCIDVANKFINNDYAVVFVGGKGELVDGLKTSLKPDSPIINIVGLTSVPELMNILNMASCVISNDTGPAHMTAHLNVKGLALFGSHTTAYKVSIERENFKPIQVNNLSNLSAQKVFERIKEKI